MTAIQLSAGKKHTIKIGGNVQEVTLLPGEVRYLPFVREVMDIPKVEKPILPYTPREAGPPATLPYTPRVTIKTYESWSSERPKPTFDDIIAIVDGVRGKSNLGFRPTFDNLVSILKKFRKEP